MNEPAAPPPMPVLSAEREADIVACGEVLCAGRSVIVKRVDVFVRRGDQRTLCAAAQQSIIPAKA